MARNPAPGAEFDLGLNYGLRSFPAHAYTGDRRILMNAEARWLLSPRLFGLVGAGVAAFVDHGGAWFHGSPRRTGTDAGVGLRLASIREAGNVWRVDVARRFETDRLPGELVVSVGSGFVF
jgi:hemolysin activation/secretion protein